MLYHVQIPPSGISDGPHMFNPSRVRSFDDAEPYMRNNKHAGRTCGLPDNVLLKSFATDKDKASSVAKIKVVVCFYL